MEFKLGDKIATREGYGKTLVELGADHDFVVCIKIQVVFVILSQRIGNI